jgi:hypothetical protein
MSDRNDPRKPEPVTSCSMNIDEATILQRRPR